MTLQEFRGIFEKLPCCKNLSLKLLNYKNLKKGICYNTHDITITEKGALADVVTAMVEYYIGNNGKLNSYEDIIDYNGSTSQTNIYRIKSDDELIKDSY